MAFDPDAYLAKNSGGGSGSFDPDAYLDKMGAGPTKENPVISGIRNLAQGASAGFSDELAGLTEGAGKIAGLDGLGGPMQDISASDDGPTLDWEVLKHAYNKARNKERETLKKDKKDNPAISTIAELAGGIASPINKVLPGNLIGQGAAFGGANALGATEAEDLGGMAKDTAIGTGLGGGLGFMAQKAGPLIEKAISKVSSGAGDLAEKMAARSLGAERGSIKKMGQDKVQDAGRYALDEGLLTPLGNTESVIAKNAAKQAEGGAMMGDVYKTIDEAGNHTFDPLNVATKVDESIGGFYRSPINRGETNQLENTLEAILMRGDKPIPLTEAQSLKQELGKVANWKNNINVTEKEKMAREAYGIVSGHIDDAVNTGMKDVGTDGLLDTLKRGKELFGNSKTAEGLLDNKLAREQGNKMFGLTDTITGGAALGYGGVTDDWKTAGGIMLAKKGLDKYGSQMGALGLDKISKSLMKSPQMAQIFEKNPQVFQALAHQLESKMGAFESRMPLPKAADQQNDSASNFHNTMGKDALLAKTQGSKYGQVLQNAAAKGDDSLSAAHYVLSQRDADYRKQIEEGE